MTEKNALLVDHIDILTVDEQIVPPSAPTFSDPTDSHPLAHLLQQQHSHSTGQYEQPDWWRDGRGTKDQMTPRGIVDNQNQGNFQGDATQ